MSKFKVGDAFKVNDDVFKVGGRTGKVTDLLNGGLLGRITNFPIPLPFREDEVSPVSQFKVGDRVTINNANGDNQEILELHPTNPKLVRLVDDKRWYHTDHLTPVRNYSTPIKQGAITATYNIDAHTIQLIHQGPGEHEEVEAWARLWVNENDNLKLRIEFTITPENREGKCQEECDNPYCGPMNVEDGTKAIFLFCQALSFHLAGSKEELTEAMKTFYDIHAKVASK